MARICMVVHAYYPLAEPRVEREARAARDAGYRVTVVALRAKGEPSRETIEGIEVRRLPLRHRRGSRLAALALEYACFAVLATCAVAVLAAREAPAVVHVHAPPDFLILAALPARLRGARVVLDIHDLSPHLFGARFNEGALATRALDVIERGSAALADSVITVHEPYRGELIQAGVPPAKIEVVMNAADEMEVSARATAGSRFKLAYHGTLTHWYGIDLIIEAVALLRDVEPPVEAVILGDGDELPHLQALARERRVADRIELSGRYLPRKEALWMVAAADCGVIPNRPSRLNRFALSSKLFEYVALGIPVVVARLETLAAYFTDQEVTFFDPGDAESLALAVRWMIEHPDEARARANRATERAQAYSWPRQRERYLRILAGSRG